MLAAEFGKTVDGCACGQAKFYGHKNSFLVNYGQSAWQTETNRTGLSVGWLAIGRAAAAEELTPGKKLSMNFKANNDFVVVYIHIW